MNERRCELTVLFGPIFKKLNSQGLTAQEFNTLKESPVAHKSLQEFVEANVEVGNFEWKNGKLFNTQRRNFLDLDATQENKLHLKAQKAGLSEEEFVSRLVLESLA